MKMKAVRLFCSHFYATYKHTKCIVIDRNVKCRFFSIDKCEFVEQNIKIRTCGYLYKKWKEDKLFAKLPENDLYFNVPYIDTSFTYSNSINRKISGTVLALHGAPGSWRDFTYLSKCLHQHGYRVIVPSFPNFHIYRPGVFRHSDLEKAQYLKDFLNAISVSNIDLLICHSSSVYPGLNLCLSNEQPTIKSLALLNPGTFNAKEMIATKPYRFLKAFAKTSENPVLLNIFEVCGPFILKNILKIPVAFESILDPLLSATTMVHAHILESKEKFLQITEKNLPVFYAFSENDPLVGIKPSHELAALLGAHSSDIFIYNKNGVLVQQGKEKNKLKILAFQEGSHYVFWKHSEIIQKEILQFLDSQKRLYS